MSFRIPEGEKSINRIVKKIKLYETIKFLDLNRSIHFEMTYDFILNYKYI